MSVFLNVDKEKNFAQNISYDISIYKQHLAQLIEDNAESGNTAVFTVLPKHLTLSEIRCLTSNLTELGYTVRFEVKELYYNFNVHWN